MLGLGLALAVKAPQTVPLRVPAKYYSELSDGALLFCVCLLITTILAHGAMIASVGLALAVWIARQSRAIALSVGFAVIVGAGWPILVSSLRAGMARDGLASLSPIAAFNQLIPVVVVRLDGIHDLWWITFWVIL